MLILFQLFAVLVILASLAWIEANGRLWTTVLTILLLGLTYTQHWDVLAWIIWPAFIVLAMIANIAMVRRFLITHPLLKIFRQVLPTMSRTEAEALEAGTSWIEADLFRGRPDSEAIQSLPASELTREEEFFIKNEVETLCRLLDDWRISHEDLDLSEEAWDYLKSKGFFGMNIPKEYGGKGFSALAQSTIVMKISTRSVTAAVTTMVPNSLGPAELLLHYGTEAQKREYLHALAVGEDVPCFALTSPEAGSDAGAIVDTGVVCRGMWQGHSVLGIRLNWNKRYITLAPVATVLGLAFKLYDPEYLLGDEAELGITLCLIPTNIPGVEIGDRHFPLNLTFMNGPTVGHDVFVPLDYIIGGAEMAGQGWRMLVECLSTGRGISLPALSIATGKMCYRMTGAYAKIRKQFKVSIGQFEGVEEAMARIAGFTYLMEATRLLTLLAIDSGAKPAVVTAITKYHMTELSRKVINDAMDIHGGRGIMLGPKNYLARAFQGIPVGITVEGANILTRNLIIYGQGAIRCHPYVQAEMACAAELHSTKAVETFDLIFWQHVRYALANIVKTGVYGLTRGAAAGNVRSDRFSPAMRRMVWMSTSLATLSDVAMLVLGGKLKRKERLSARLGDVLSHLYMATAVLHYYDTHQQPVEDEDYVEWTLQYCLHQMQQAIVDFCDNFPGKWLGKGLKRLIFPWGPSFSVPSDHLSHKLVEKMMVPSEFRDRLTQHIYTNSDPEDVSGLMEVTFQKLQMIIPIEQKVREAIAQDLLPKGGDWLALALKARDRNILTAQELRLLQEYEILRQKAIGVDSFDPNYLARGGRL